MALCTPFRCSWLAARSPGRLVCAFRPFNRPDTGRLARVSTTSTASDFAIHVRPYHRP